MLLESFLDLRHRNLVPVSIPVQDAVETDGNMSQHKRAERNVGMKGAGRSETDDIQSLMLWLDLAGSEINIGESIQLGHYYVDIVRSDTM